MKTRIIKKKLLFLIGAFFVLVPLAGQAVPIGVDNDSYVEQRPSAVDFETDTEALIKLDRAAGHLDSGNPNKEHGLDIYGLAGASDGREETSMTGNNVLDPTEETPGDLSLTGKGAKLTQFPSSEQLDFPNNDEDETGDNPAHTSTKRKGTFHKSVIIGVIVVLGAGLLGARRFFMM